MTSSRLTFDAPDELATAHLGRALANVLPSGCVVALQGTLGAGKTRLVQAIAEACGIDRRDVVSPTFVLVQEHHGRQTLYHVDAYRVRDEDEFRQLGVDEYFASDAIVLIEWADRIPACLPEEYIEIVIEVTGDSSRHFEIRACGRRYAPVIDELSRTLSG